MTDAAVFGSVVLFAGTWEEDGSQYINVRVYVRAMASRRGQCAPPQDSKEEGTQVLDILGMLFRLRDSMLGSSGRGRGLGL